MESGEVPSWSCDGAAGCSVQQLELTSASLENIQHGRYLENNMKHLSRPGYCYLVYLLRSKCKLASVVRSGSFEVRNGCVLR